MHGSVASSQTEVAWLDLLLRLEVSGTPGVSTAWGGYTCSLPARAARTFALGGRRVFDVSAGN